jgi:NAD-dependent deacetylase
MPPPLASSLDDARLRQALASRSVVCLTGAGISAESGIPTFRGADGLWKKFRPEELATVDAFLANPELVWEWYRFRREKIAGAAPNAGHHALASWQEKAEAFHLITQNVDGLHQRAGSRDVIELHGSIWRDRCVECGARRETHTPGEAGVPQCACGGRMRPDVVWFGEWLPEEALARSFSLAAACEVFLLVGTSAVVQPAADLPVVAKRHGACLIEVNPEPTVLSGRADFNFFAPAGEVLPRLLEAVA